MGDEVSRSAVVVIDACFLDIFSFFVSVVKVQILRIIANLVVERYLGIGFTN